MHDLLDVVHNRSRDLCRQFAYERWKASADSWNRFGMKFWDQRWFEVPELEQKVLALAQKRWAAAQHLPSSLETPISILKVVGMLGQGLPYPRQLIDPQPATAVDILCRLEQLPSTAKAMELSGATAMQHPKQHCKLAGAIEPELVGTSKTSTTAVSDVLREDQERRRKLDELQEHQERAALRASGDECATAKTFTIFLAGKKGPAQHLRTWRSNIHGSSRLGIDWKEPSLEVPSWVTRLWGHHYLTLYRVEEKGVVPQWNKSNPDKQVVAGSRIVEINGERGDCKRLTSLLQSGYELNVVVIPESALTPLHELKAMEKEKSDIQ